MNYNKETIVLYPKEFINCVWDKTQNKLLSRLLEEIKIETHSKRLDISLLQPEHSSQRTFETTSFSNGSKRDGYVICLHPRHAVDLEIARLVIDHELFHIRKGHCDLYERLLFPFNIMFDWLVAEPLAHFYTILKYHYTI